MNKPDKYISLEEFEEMWKNMKKCMLTQTPNIHPQNKYITVQGHSGEGTDFANEYDRMMHEHFNPPMPTQIRKIDYDGEYIIRIKK